MKVYDKTRPSAQAWVERMDAYIPIQLWLHENTPLRERMVAPLPTTSGAYKVTGSRYVLLVFPMLHGTTLGGVQINAAQTQQLAEILAELHTYTNQIPVQSDGINEDYSLPFLAELATLLEAKKHSASLDEILRQHGRNIENGAEQLQALAASLHSKCLPHVLCHTDVHGGNLLWTDKLILIDWEGLLLAPAEADLFAFTDGFFFGYAKEDFMRTYQSVRNEYTRSEEALQFYRLRRRMQDITEFIHCLTYDSLSEQEALNALEHMKRECVLLPTLL